MKFDVDVFIGGPMYKRKAIKCTQAYLGVSLAEDTLMIKLAKIEYHVVAVKMDFYHALPPQTGETQL